MNKEIKEINNEILRVTQSVVVHVPQYSRFGGYEGMRDIYTMNIAEALYNAGCRKRSENTVEVVRCKDCIHYHDGVCAHFSYHTYASDVDEDDFCSYGSRKEQI